LWGQGEWREIEVDGRTVRVEIVEGEAIWQGDIVLGTPGKMGRASAVVTGQRFRWTDNVMPYVIDDDVPDRARVEGAIRHWNERTVMRMVPRTGEANYIQFRRRNGFACSSNVGMIGGRQFINLPDNCALGSVIHEIGHAAGLYHTQSREDRDLYIRVNEDGIQRDSLSQYARQLTASEDVGTYPFESIMHYNTTGFALPGETAMTTVPAGIPLGQRDGLSASDVDTLARMQGARPAKTVIASNPAGLEVTVDGERVTTPAEFDWPAGSRHTVSVEDREDGGTRLEFARWSDFGDRAHEITAGPETTVFTAHMRRLLRLPVAASPTNGGRVEVRGAAEGTWFPDGGRVELEAQPAEGFRFANWSGFGFFTAHGSANPIRFAMLSPLLTYTAGFTTSAVTTVTTSPAGLRIQVDGTAYTAPRQFVWAAGTRHEVNIETLEQSTLGGGALHRFRGWSDGGEQRHTVTAEAGGGTVTAEFDTSYQVLTAAAPLAGGRVVLDPPVTDGRLAAGTVVTATAEPANGFGFTGWAGNRPGLAARQEIVVDGVLDLQARFAQPGVLTAAGLVNAASYGGGTVAPGEIVTIFGLGLGPEELAGLTLTAERRVATAAGGVRVLFDGTPAPMIYASSRQLGAIVPFNVAGKSVVRAQVEVDGRLSNPVTLNVAATAPGLFTANASGVGGGAFLNQDGSLNTEGNPAERGSIVVLYATGLGAMTPAMRDGELAGAPFARPAAAVRVFIGDRECEVFYAGAAPGLVAGLAQLNVRVPAELGPGVMPVVVEAGGVRSPRTVGLAVR
jgi:astacin